LKADVYRPGRLAVDRRARRDNGDVKPALSPAGRTLLTGVFILAAAAAVVFVFVIALNSDYVCVHTVDVDGNSYITDEEVIRVSGINEGSRLFSLDLGEAEDKLKKNPAIIDASVSRRFPDKILIKVEERRAVGTVIVGDELYKIAEDGIIVGELDAEYEDLPLICGLAMKPGEGDVVGMRFSGREMEEVLDVLVALRTEPALYANVDYVRADERWFVLSGGGVKVFYGSRFGHREANRVWRVWRILPSEERAGCTMDVRFEGDVVVRKRAAVGKRPEGGGDSGGEG
jgi:hypothetical protein